jgi:general secretion pathway protein K
MVRPSPSVISLQGRAFTIRAEITRPTGVVVREAAVRLTDNPAQPYLVLNWKAKGGTP